MPIFSIIFSTLIILGQFIAITALFCSIKFYNEMDISTRISMSIRTILGLAYLFIFIHYCGSIFECSKMFYEYNLRNYKCLLKMEKYIYKSFRPIRFTIGQFSTIDKITYLIVLSDIILANLADLLIAYKTTHIQ